MSGHDTPEEPIAPKHGVCEDGHRERMMNAQGEDDLERANNRHWRNARKVYQLGLIFPYEI